MKRLVGLAALLLFATDWGRTDIRFDFAGFPPEVRGPADSRQEFQAFATLSVGEHEAEDSWSLSMTAVGGKIIDVSISGLSVLTRSNQGRIRDLRLGEWSFFSIQYPTLDGQQEVTHEDDPDRHGAMSAIVGLDYPNVGTELLADLQHRVARITVEVTMPPEGETREVTLRYEDGFRVADAPGQGMTNGVIYHGSQVLPDVTVERKIVLHGGAAEFRRGDANEDGELDVSDVIFALGHLFLGDDASRCEPSIDTNDDGTIDISDPVYLILYLFSGGNEPPSPFAECGFDTTDDGLFCESFSPCM